MRRIRIFALLFAMIMAVAFVCACSRTRDEYEITLNTDKSFVIEVGDEIDYTEYFTVKDKNGNQIVVTTDMLDLSCADTSMPGRSP